MTRTPTDKWNKIPGTFSYDIREKSSGVIFVFVGSQESTEEERDAALEHTMTWGKDSIQKDRIHHIHPIYKKN